MSHTPGPWGVQPDEHGGPSDTVYAYEDQQQPVAEIVSGVNADRNLVAAAPDMLDALRLADDALDYAQAQVDSDSDRERLKQWRERVQNVIALAEGR